MLQKKLKFILLVILIGIASYLAYRYFKTVNPNINFTVGQKLDSLNGVYVYYNGGVGHIGDRNISSDGYNIGLKYQCVEFVKRYYYQFYNHKMPDSYGNAKDFFDKKIQDGNMNMKRNLIQCTNLSTQKPQVGDLLIFDGNAANPYGHVAIVAQCNANDIQIIQQNPGPFATPRVQFKLYVIKNRYKIDSQKLLGWLKIKNK